MRHQREEKQVSEDREQASGEDRDVNIDEVEGHNLAGTLVGQAAGQQADAADEDEPDVEGHALINANAGEPADTNTGVNTGEPTDTNIA
jgi:hypothetical protein